MGAEWNCGYEPNAFAVGAHWRTLIGLENIRRLCILPGDFPKDDVIALARFSRFKFTLRISFTSSLWPWAAYSSRRPHYSAPNIRTSCLISIVEKPSAIACPPATPAPNAPRLRAN